VDVRRSPRPAVSTPQACAGECVRRAPRASLCRPQAPRRASASPASAARVAGTSSPCHPSAGRVSSASRAIPTSPASACRGPASRSLPMGVHRRRTAAHRAPSFTGLPAPCVSREDVTARPDATPEVGGRRPYARLLELEIGHRDRVASGSSRNRLTSWRKRPGESCIEKWPPGIMTNSLPLTSL